METNKYAIAILTHDAPDRAEALKYTLWSLASNTDLSSIDIHVFFDHYNDNMLEVLQNFLAENQLAEVNLHLNENPEVNGCGKSVNWVWEVTKNYKYTLFLEGDWVLLPQQSNKWLKDLIDLMDSHPNVASTFLRHFYGDCEMRQYNAILYWHNPANRLEEFRFGDENRLVYRITKGIYTNNPHLRRNSMYNKLGVLPLEVYDEADTKDSDNWSKPEQNAEHKLDGAELFVIPNGLFEHYEFSLNENEFTYDDKTMLEAHTVHCPNGPICRFGFQEENRKFCKACQLCESTELYDIEHDYIEKEFWKDEE